MSKRSRTQAEEEEDWRNLTDANERRRIQNRLAQRNYRRNVKRRLQQLEVLDKIISERPTIPDTLTTHLNIGQSQNQQPISNTPTPETPAIDNDLSDMTRFSSDNFENQISHAYISPLATMPSVPASCATPDEAVVALGGSSANNEMDLSMFDDSLEMVHDMSTRDTRNSRDEKCPPSPSRSLSPLHLSIPHKGHTPLQKAVLRGHLGIAEILVQGGADVCAVNEFGQTILHLAAEAGHAKLIEFAVKKGVLPDVVDYFGRTALHVAVEAGKEDVVRALVGLGCDLERRCDGVGGGLGGDESVL